MPSASLAVKAGTRSRGTRLFRLLRPPHYWPNYPANSRYEGLLAGSKPESMRCLFALSLLLTAGVGTRNMMRCLRNLLRRPAERKRLPTISPFQVLKLHASVGAAAHGIKSSNLAAGTCFFRKWFLKSNKKWQVLPTPCILHVTPNSERPPQSYHAAGSGPGHGRGRHNSVSAQSACPGHCPSPLCAYHIHRCGEGISWSPDVAATTGKMDARAIPKHVQGAGNKVQR